MQGIAELLNPEKLEAEQSGYSEEIAMRETQNETTLSEEPSTSQTFDPKTFLLNPRPYARESVKTKIS